MSSHKSKVTRLEKDFYSTKNFKLLEEVLLDMVDKNSFKNDHKELIFNSMEQVYKETNIPSTLQRGERKKILSSLNKNVLSRIADYVKNNKTVPQKDVSQSSHQMTHFTPAPSKNNGNPLTAQHQQPINQFNQFAIFPQDDSKNKEVKSFFAREFSQPPTNSSLHPIHNLENFPSVKSNTSLNNTRSLFEQMGQERAESSNRFSKSKKVDFSLPQNTKDDINPENKFQELMKNREMDDNNIINKVPNPEVIPKVNPEKINKTQDIFSSNFITDPSVNFNKFQNNINYNSITEGLDDNLLNMNEIIDIPEQLKKSNTESTQSTQQSQQPQQFQPPQQQSQQPQQFQKSQQFQQSQQQQSSQQQQQPQQFQQPQQSQQPQQFQPPQQQQQPQQFQQLQQPQQFQQSNESQQFEKTKETNPFENLKSYPVEEKNSKDRIDKEQIDKYLDDPKVIYLTILSKYRNTDLYPNPANFSMLLEKKNGNNEIKILDETIFNYDKEQDELIDLKDVNSILSVECLDVVIPKSSDILREPYLWLCVDEWGFSNIGTGVPKGAFARLKVVPGNNDLPFVTMRAHLLERQYPSELSKELTFRLLTSDGEEINIVDRKEVSEINETKNMTVINLDSEKNEFKPGDKLYFYSLFNEVIGFYHSVYIHDLKVNGDKLSLRLFVDKDPDDANNRVGKFINKETKERIIASKYLEVGDKLFLEFIKTNKHSGKFEIIDIKDDIITIHFPQTRRKFTPKKISKIGFIKKEGKGYVSEFKEDLNYKGGITINKVEGNKIYLNNKFNYDGEYFFLERKSQVSYMFRVTYI